MVKKLSLLFYSGLLLFSANIFADLNTINTLSQQGAWASAWHLLDQEQPPQNDPQWAKWQTVRLNSLTQNPEWPATATTHLLDASQSTDKSLSRLAVSLLFKQAAQQHNALNAQKWGWLLLNSAANDTEHRRIRRVLIDSYLWDGQVNDAVTAMTRYQQDFGPLGGEDLINLTQSFLRLNALQAAKAWINQLPAGHPVQLTLAWKLQLLPADRLLQLAQQAQARSADIRNWQLISTLSPSNTSLRLTALEQLCSSKAEALADIPPVSAATLWQAYTDYGLTHGMQLNLIQGEDESWLKQASIESNPVDSRALWAWLSLNAQEQTLRTQALELLQNSLATTAEGRATWLALALDLQAQQQLTELRYKSALIAKAIGNKKAEATLWQTLTEIPTGISSTDWHLQKAAALITTAPQTALSELQILSQSEVALSIDQSDLLLNTLSQLSPIERTPLLKSLVPKLRIDTPSSLKKLGQMYLQQGNLNALCDTWLKLSIMEPNPANQALALSALESAGRHLDAQNLRATWSKSSLRKKP